MLGAEGPARGHVRRTEDSPQISGSRIERYGDGVDEHSNRALHVERRAVSDAGPNGEPVLPKLPGHRPAEAAEQVHEQTGPVPLSGLPRHDRRSPIEHHHPHSGAAVGSGLCANGTTRAAESGRPVCYTEYAAWQEEWLTGPQAQAHLDAACSNLAGVPANLELPADFPRPPIPSTAADSVDLTLPEVVSKGVADLAALCLTTPFVVMLAAWQVLLARYARTDDIVVGIPIDGRNHEALASVIGCFVNTLPVRSRLNMRAGFRDAVARVRAAVLDAMDRQDVPFERLVDKLALDRDTSCNPLFQAWFDHRDGTGPGSAGLKLAGSRTHVLVRRPSHTRFDVELHTAGIDGLIIGQVVYPISLFDRSTMTQLARHFQNLITAAVKDPRMSVAALPLLDEEERKSLLHAVNPVAGQRHATEDLLDGWTEQVAAAPDAIAVSDREGELSYRELDRRSDGLAARLRSLGAGPGYVVGVCLPRGIGAIVAMLSALKAGAAYTPVDLDLPQSRVSGILSDARVGIVITNEEHAGRVPAQHLPLMLISNSSHAPPANGTPSGAKPAPDDLAYVIFTSGTTGRPKGVAIRRRGLRNLIDWHTGTYHLARGDRVAQLASLSFDAGRVGDMAGALVRCHAPYPARRRC